MLYDLFENLKLKSITKEKVEEDPLKYYQILKKCILDDIALSSSQKIKIIKLMK